MKKRTFFNILFFAISFWVSAGAQGNVGGEGVRVKDLCRVVGVRDNSLVGYGIVTGLAGTGDSSRSRATTQSIANTLKRFGVTISPQAINSRNVAAVMVTASLPAFARPGDKLDVNVTSIGDSRSLLGGTLLLTSLRGANHRIVGLAQGPLSVGGFKYDLNGNVVQKNHPTSGNIPNGATVEAEIGTNILDETGNVTLKLHSPDFTTASRLKTELNRQFGQNVARSIDAGRVAVRVPARYRNDVTGFLMALENTKVEPDLKARVVINERTGTVVSGGEVWISDVTISHGDLKLSIVTDFLVSQPLLVRDTGPGVRTQVVPDTQIDVKEDKPIALSFEGRTSVADLVATLNKIKTSSRDVITILQAIKRAGALHAELIIQ